MSQKLIYMDHSATTPVDERVAKKVYDAMLEGWGNPSSRYAKGQAAKEAREEARTHVAKLLHAPAECVFFTSGGTEADNLALIGVMQQAKKDGRGNHLITSSFEHSAILKAAAYLEEEGFEVTYLPISADGFVEPDELKKAMRKDTVLVSVMHINNEIGTIQPIKELAAVAHENGAWFHTDAVQSFGKEAIYVKEMGLDLVSVSSHKIYGPKGVGALYYSEAVKLQPRALGGGQEKGIRTGTENMPGIIGFGEAVRLCSELIATEQVEIAKLRDRLWDKLQDILGDGVRLNGNLEHRLGANLNVSFPEVEGESLLLSLDMDGIAVSTGSACSSGSTKPSHVLTAINLDAQTAQSSLRLTLGRSTTEEDVDFVAERLAMHVKRFRDMAF